MLKNVIIAQQKAAVTTGTAYTAIYNRFTDPVQRKRLKTDVNMEEQGDNCVEQT